MIVTDTNIWMRMKNDADIKRLKSIGVLPSFLNLHEMGSSSLLYRKPKLIFRGYLNINKFLDSNSSVTFLGQSHSKNVEKRRTKSN